MFFPSILLLLLVITLLCSTQSSEKASGGSKKISSETKAKQIYDLSRKEKSNVVTLDDASYVYYAIDKPRPYTLIVFLTAAHPKFKCAVCTQMDKDFRTIAQTYLQYTVQKKIVPSIFFIRIDYETAQKTFQNYELNTVPYLFYISPYLGEKAVRDYEISTRDKFQISTEPKIDATLQFFKDRYSNKYPTQNKQINNKTAHCIFWRTQNGCTPGGERQ